MILDKEELQVQLFIERLQTDQAFLIQTIAMGFMFILVIILFIQYYKLKKRFNIAVHNQDGMSIESIIHQYYGDVETVKLTQEGILQRQEEILEILQHCFTKVGMVRFNPFAEVGGDQSFAIALLDRENNGLVISSLFSRTNSRFYGKPVVNGKSSYSLSEEEEEAIKQAMNVQMQEAI